VPQTVLDLAAARRWAVTARALLSEARERIDALNVFPVPDGDTGTNMFLTVDGALDLVRGQHEVAGAPLRLDQGLALLARGMLLSARGNSGVILSQLARGMSEAVAEAGPGVHHMGPEVLADAFERAADVAWAGVSRPVEGTILSVASGAAAGARSALAQGGTTYAVALAALEAARAALAQTPEQLPRLAQAGVVDAGGAGLVLVIEALESVLDDRPHEGLGALADWWEQGPVEVPPRELLDGCQAGDGAYEVMYLVLGSDPERAHHLQAHLVRIGSSVLVVGGPREWRVHVHLDDPAAAVEAGSLAGRVEEVAITSLETDGGTARGPARSRPLAPLGVVACAPGDGIAALMAHAGAEVVHSGARRRASTGQLLGAARAVAAGTVVVLPNDPDTILAAEAAARAAADEGLDVRVLPTRAAVQGLAAMAVCDLEGDVEATLVAMADAAAAVAYGSLAVAANDGSTPVGECRAGQWLGLVSGEIVVVEDQLNRAARHVLGALSDGAAHDPELLTVVGGHDTGPHDLDPALAAWGRRHRDVEVHRIEGGQRTFRWLIGME
jgi:DAK2 domain fusion protein YloV